LLKKLAKKTDFQKTSYKNVQYFNLVHAHKPKFGLLFSFAIARSEFFFLPVSFFSAFLPSLPFAFNILSGCHKKVGVNYGQSLAMEPRSIIDIMGHFAPKLIMLLFNLLRQNAVNIQNCVLSG